MLTGGQIIYAGLCTACKQRPAYVSFITSPPSMLCVRPGTDNDNWLRKACYSTSTTNGSYSAYTRPLKRSLQSP